MITTVTLNASIDKAYQLADSLIGGTVMRVQEVRNSAGGKGINVARAIQLCGYDVQATGLVGGFNGSYLEWLLEKDGVPSRFTHVSGETRSCINILDETFGSTEFLESGCQVSAEELQNFYDNYLQLLEHTDVVTISGSLPVGVPTDTYYHLITYAKEAGKKVILDSSGLSFQGALKAKPTLIKPNQDELEALYGTKISTNEEVLTYAQKLVREGIEYVVISLGKDGAVLLHNGNIYKGIPPQIKPVNTVGCGDSMVGALAIGLQKGSSPEECLRYAIAVGTANALSPHTGRFNPDDLKWIYDAVTIVRLGKL